MLGVAVSAAGHVMCLVFGYAVVIIHFSMMFHYMTMLFNDCNRVPFA